MSNNSGNIRLNPIYAAIDAHQYNRAIKLASGLPDSNVLGKALLAHCYTRAGQRHLALVTLQRILGVLAGELYFFELQRELNYDLESTLERQKQQASSSTSSTTGTPTIEGLSGKKGKKGKKKTTSAPKQPAAATSNATAPSSLEVDLIDQLTVSPSLPEKLDEYPASDKAITDETTLATLAVSLQSLKMPFTAYQMYAWASNAKPTEFNLSKTFFFGLSVLSAPSKWQIESQNRMEKHILAHMQAVSLQWARLSVSSSSPQSNTSNFNIMLATAWAAQTALWQLEWLSEDEQRKLLLPRLAESMAKRLVQQEAEQGLSPSAETHLLLFRTLQVQLKWEEMLHVLEDLSKRASTGAGSDRISLLPSEFGVPLTEHQILIEKAKLLRKLCQCESTRTVYERLLQKNPDDWLCWKGHMESSIFEDRIDITQSLVEKVLQEMNGDKIQLRGPHLMIVEIAFERIRKSSTTEAFFAGGAAIQQYAEKFAHRASCTFSDLEIYVNILLHSSEDAARDSSLALVEFSQTLRKRNVSSYKDSDDYCVEGTRLSNKERQSRVRAYIFALKLTQKLLSHRPDLVPRFLPDWVEIVAEWRATLSLSTSNEGEETQKELRPGDELVLLAVQQLLSNDKNGFENNALLISAALLESAIQNSPENAYLKFVAMDVYHRLDATTRSWELFQTIGIKHIQFDTCAFVILPHLFSGGLYNETIEVCRAQLQFHAGSAKECGDYAGKAMESGTLSKANEFMEFQRRKMNRSLTHFYSKGLILDSAPLLATEVPQSQHDGNHVLKGGLGISQGIVGGGEDGERVAKMVVESHNPHASLNIVSFADSCGSLDVVDDFSDNRDLSILTQNATFINPSIESKSSMVQDTLRRGYVHRLLICAALCVEVVKGPKKGKVVKSGEILEKRTKSLLKSVLGASEFFGYQMDSKSSVNHEVGCQALLYSFSELCRFLAIINAGIPLTGEDSMERREDEATNLMKNKILPQLKEAHAKIAPTLNVRAICALLPNYVVPIFSLVRMCSKVCVVYGWGRRKRKSKKVAGAMADLAAALNELVGDMLSTVNSLPISESESLLEYKLTDHELQALAGVELMNTTQILNQARFQIRMRLEPILQEMDEFLDEFNQCDET